MNNYHSDLVQVTDIYSAAYDSNCRMWKVNKNHGFEKAVLVLEFDATKESEEALIDATKSKEDKQKSNNVKKKDHQDQIKCGL